MARRQLKKTATTSLQGRVVASNSSSGVSFEIFQDESARRLSSTSENEEEPMLRDHRVLFTVVIASDNRSSPATMTFESVCTAHQREAQQDITIHNLQSPYTVSWPVKFV